MMKKKKKNEEEKRKKKKESKVRRKRKSTKQEEEEEEKPVPLRKIDAEIVAETLVYICSQFPYGRLMPRLWPRRWCISAAGCVFQRKCSATKGCS
ncbi:hypothetical protein PoB_003842900 [Plakobranchus ocellatus]|uniref:Uncharacterized protein n=1 Tax=Plakobranchus ocellatus TaxID=259542 RepID=A0AAV4B0M9_9GAST|nr:hypothetical protein PoB_003842900 [Plakobranchus ocellatus]